MLHAKNVFIQTYSCLLCLKVLMMNKDINTAELDFLLRYPVQPGATSPVVFLSNHSWGGIKVKNEATNIIVAFKCKRVLFFCVYRLDLLYNFLSHAKMKIKIINFSKKKNCTLQDLVIHPRILPALFCHCDSPLSTLLLQKHVVKFFTKL